MSPSIGETWTELLGELEKAPSGARARRRIHGESGRDLFVWAQEHEPQRGLELEVSAAVLSELSIAASSQGIVMSKGASASGRASLHLELKDPSAIDLFVPLCENISDLVSAQKDDATAVAAWMNRFERWMRFLQRAPSGLSSVAQRGLYGELVVFRDIYCAVMDPAEAVSAWVGPLRKPRDFELNGRAVEVKTNATNEPQVVKISGERQLDDATLTSLHLVHLSLEVLNGSGETLPEAVASARALVDSTPAEFEFEDLLLEAGYADLHEPKYLTSGYGERKLTVYLVEPGFPRLTENQLPEGVGGVTYTLVIDVCAKFTVELDSLKSQLKADGG